MLSNHTHERLAALGLAGMAKAFDDQQRQPDVTALTFEQRLGLMINREATTTIVEDVDLRAPRGIDRAFFAKLVDGDWIGRKQNLLIIGPTGVGKSWIACVAACGLALQKPRRPKNVRSSTTCRACRSCRSSRPDLRCAPG
jgi:hypothetical protein